MKINDAHERYCPFYCNFCRTVKCMLWKTSGRAEGYCCVERAATIFMDMDKKPKQKKNHKPKHLSETLKKIEIGKT